jgi:hypothetical protein
MRHSKFELLFNRRQQQDTISGVLENRGTGCWNMERSVRQRMRCLVKVRVPYKYNLNIFTYIHVHVYARP